ncbi:pentatricopeptide repeat-containing protein At2g29760, chloroplastic-like [Punica granatum]|uniref:Pentatricopeptide repeat-containing protein At2g29760, chloroplastic-like n=2 Tax=Punica granatum TaxID=22663 RepID=A0A6P8EI06_PUNGR|nr:pentatricopeptide repeat-containing protein At2g29760, chloroplastic-like [Punica granatum]PKI63228.1 hypothetical protein CRG98_016413 [Punica granatum]
MSSILECPKTPFSRANLCSLLTFAQNPLQELTFLLQRCKQIRQLNQIHAHLITTGLVQWPPLASKLVASFASSPFPNAVSTARAIASSVRGLDAYTWNTLIRGHLYRHDHKGAILVYSQLQRSGFEVDSYTLLFVIKACGSMPGISLGKQIHSHVLKSSFISEVIIQTALMNMYCSFDELRSMRQLFDEMPHRDAVAWNALLSSYSLRKFPLEALDVSHAMLRQGVAHTGVTLVSVISSCSALRLLREGKSVHGYLVKKLLNIDVFIHNALIEMYSKCGSLISASRIFHSMLEKTIVSWTSMINGYTHNNCLNEAVCLFREMESTNVKPDEVTLLSAISLCSKLGRVELGDWLSHWVDEVALGRRSVSVANALIGMYSKCGNIIKACQMFDSMEERTLLSWAAAIHGLAMHGHGVYALTRFVQMLREGLKPDEILFLSVLFGCSHSGLVDEGRKCFNSMRNDYGIEPWVDHYGCMVDLFCRAGLVNEAVEFVSDMPIEPDEIIYRMLLGACQDHGLSSLAGWVQEKLAQLGPRNCEDYVLLSNFHASMAEWDVVRDVRKEMEARGAYKTDPGCSFVEVEEHVQSID